MFLVQWVVILPFLLNISAYYLNQFHSLLATILQLAPSPGTVCVFGCIYDCVVVGV